MKIELSFNVRNNMKRIQKKAIHSCIETFTYAGSVHNCMNKAQQTLNEAEEDNNKICGKFNKRY